jgi:Predicted dehydrogenases and related proteins
MPEVKLFAALLLTPLLIAGADLRLGIIGTDTSHVIEFTKMLNDASLPDHVPGARVVAAYKGGSKDIKSSADRIDKFAEELKTKWKIEFSPDIASLCRKVDAVLIESVDGRQHLEQAKAVIAAGKPMFIDKPLASTLEDAGDREARQRLRASLVQLLQPALGEIGTTMKYPDTLGVTTWGPGPLEEHHHLDLAWYAIHPVEILYTLMGMGCEEVTRTYTDGADVVVGRWRGGRIGSVRALRPYGGYGAIVFRAKTVSRATPRPRQATVRW